jgi:hypothetical protein
MDENKTQPTDLDPEMVLSAFEPTRQADARSIDRLMRRLSGRDPVMWGANMFGYGAYEYRYASGRSGRFFRTGFAVRAREFVIYVMAGFAGMEDDLAALGRHKTGKSCLYVKKLDGIDLDALERIIARSLACMAERYPNGT